MALGNSFYVNDIVALPLMWKKTKVAPADDENANVTFLPDVDIV